MDSNDPIDGAIREGEPPYFPSRTQAAKPWSWKYVVLGGILFCSGLALFCFFYEPNYFDEPEVREYPESVESVRMMVAWIVENRPIPGFAEQDPNAEFIKDEVKEFIVACDIPQDVSVSGDPRVRRVTFNKSRRIYERNHFFGKYGRVDYIHIKHKHSQEGKLIFEMYNGFDENFITIYEFEFQRADGKLKGKGKATGHILA